MLSKDLSRTKKMEEEGSKKKDIKGMKCDGSPYLTLSDLEAEPDLGRSPFFESNSFFFCQ